MIVINHSAELIDFTIDPVTYIADVARTCYKSEYKNPSADEALIRRLIKRDHTSMLEFAHLTFRIVTDRGVSHELVRHRIASYAQESTRWCNYQDCDIKFIKPVMIPNDSDVEHMWLGAMHEAEKAYKGLIKYCRVSPQIARSVLPNSLATTIVAKMNLRSFRNFIKLRTAKDAHPDMRVVAALCKDLAIAHGFSIFLEDL